MFLLMPENSVEHTKEARYLPKTRRYRRHHIQSPAAGPGPGTMKCRLTAGRQNRLHIRSRSKEQMSDDLLYTRTELNMN